MARKKDSCPRSEIRRLSDNPTHGLKPNKVNSPPNVAKHDGQKVGFADIDTSDIHVKFSRQLSVPTIFEPSTQLMNGHKMQTSGNQDENKCGVHENADAANVASVGKKVTWEDEKSPRFWLRRLFGHRVLWFLILMPIYVIFITVTIIFATSVDNVHDPGQSSPADTFFGIIYILFMVTVLSFVLRYFCHKCDHESARCTCQPEQLIHEVVRRNQFDPKRKFLERPQPFVAKKAAAIPPTILTPKYPLPQNV